MKFSEIESKIENQLIDILVLLNTKEKIDSLKNLNIYDLCLKVHDSVVLIIDQITQNNKNERFQTEDNLNAIMINDYEKQMIKLEQDIRSHIKVEFQLKIYCENLESRINEFERLVEEQAKEKAKFIESHQISLNTINLLQDKICNYDEEIKELKNQIKSYSTVNNISIRNNNTIHLLNDKSKIASLKKRENDNVSIGLFNRSPSPVDKIEKINKIKNGNLIVDKKKLNKSSSINFNQNNTRFSNTNTFNNMCSKQTYRREELSEPKNTQYNISQINNMSTNFLAKIKGKQNDNKHIFSSMSKTSAVESFGHKAK